MSFRRDILDDDDPMAGLDFAIHGNEGAGLAATDLNAVLSPLQQLIRYWQNERYAPDILPSQEITLNALLDHIHRQIKSDIVQLLRNDPDSSEDEHFRIMLAQIEIERAKFVVRSYVRTRLYKIERYSRLITSDPSLHGRLSKTELSHAQRFAKLTENHFQTTVLNSLPEDQRGLDDDAAFIPPMIPAPNQSHAVFVHAREDCPEVKLPDGNRLDIKRGHIMLTPYSVIDQLLIDDSVELI